MPLGALIATLILIAIGSYLLLSSSEKPFRWFGGVILSLGMVLLLSFWFGRYATARCPDFLFALSSVIAVISAIKVISHQKIIYSAMYLVLLVMATAMLVLLLGGQFLAAILILVYAGAIIVVYIFAIMLARQPDFETSDINLRRVLTAVLSAIILAGIIAMIPELDFEKLPAQPDQSNVSALGKVILIDYVIALEMAGALLLAAVIGGIAIARFKSQET